MSRTPHILIVDGDREIRNRVMRFLVEHGFRVTPAADSRGMSLALKTGRFDLIVLDLMLPGDDGLTLCREIRARSQVPIIMLTALGEDIDRIVGLEVGADDYLPKPFNPRELLVRIRAVLRRAAHAPRDPLPHEVRAYRFAGWRLDVTSRTLTHENGNTVPLTGAEFRLLSVLLAHPHRVLSRVQLAELTRGRDIDPFDRSIDVRISRLRQALGDGGRSPQIIKTIYGEGYLIGVEVVQETSNSE